MPILSGSVGLGGDNWMHDVAAVQATLMVANGLEGAPYWRGGIDGRAGPAVGRAIANF